MRVACAVLPTLMTEHCHMLGRAARPGGPADFALLRTATRSTESSQLSACI